MWEEWGEEENSYHLLQLHQVQSFANAAGVIEIEGVPLDAELAQMSAGVERSCDSPGNRAMAVRPCQLCRPFVCSILNLPLTLGLCTRTPYPLTPACTSPPQSW